jgi:hypothetical protein
MREARIIFPTEPLARERTRFEHDLVSVFGGFISNDGYSAWMNDEGGVTQEQVTIYDIAMRDEFRDYGQLKNLAVEYGRRLAQEAVYVRFPSGDVEIIHLGAKRAPEASPAPEKAPYDPADRLNQAEKAFLDRLMDPEGVMGEPKAYDRSISPEGEFVIGAKRLPKPGEVWSTVSGGKAAVTGRASIQDGGYYASLLDPGNYAGVNPGYGFTVNLDGKHLRGGDAHPLDLKRFLTAF